MEIDWKQYSVYGEGCFIFDFITIGGLLAHLAYHVHKSGHKTSIIILHS